ncbi:MAG: ABC transporter permease [Myxococcales bacterium]|nr:ABC transporter permease [Myxococcales bacterium]
MQSARCSGVSWSVSQNMPLNIFMTKYQRFVAWRYLMERERELSSSVLVFISFCLWLALGMGAACLWYPLADLFQVPPPNPPAWLIPMVGLSCALPVVALAGAKVNALRGRNVRAPLLLAVHGVLLALGAIAVFHKSVGAGLSDNEVVLIWVLFPLCAIGAPVQASFLGAFVGGRQPVGVIATLSYLFTPIGFFLWIAMRIPRLPQRASVFAFQLGLQLAATAVLLAAGAYKGLRASVWQEFFPVSADTPTWTKLACTCAVGAVVALTIYALSVLRKRRKPAAFDAFLGGIAGVGVIGIGLRFMAGVDQVTINLDFIGGWPSYTPPMGMVMPALVAAAVAILAGVLLLARFAFTFFTTVSIGGVTIGTMALVIVLSVMSGFETDLREKILGFNAHIQISKADELQFEGYREVQAVLEKTGGVEGFTPFLTTEAYMSNHNNYGNVTLKGIDPLRVASVTEIVHNLEKGDERALEKLWPLEEDGSIVGKPKEGAKEDDFELDDGPADFSGGLDEIEDEPIDDFELDGPKDFSGGLDELPDAGPNDALVTAPKKTRDWDVDLLPHDYIAPSTAILDGVLVGRELVKTVNLYTDQEVRVISPLPNTSPDGLSIPRLENFRVAGRFFSGMYEYDLKYVYCSLYALQDFLDLGDVVNGIEVRVDDPRNTAAIVRSLEESLGEGYRVQDWKELNRALFSALKLEKIAMFFILVIIVLVASFSIVGNLIMVVIEKAKEIAILKTLGSSDAGVMKIFITQGFFIGLVGTTLGVALGLGACYLGMTFGVPLDPDVYYIDKLPIQVEGSSVLAVGAAGLAISVVATIYPAYIAARMRPIKGLRWD